MTNTSPFIDVFGAENVSPYVDFQGNRYPCALGPAGIKNHKVEGDGVTPAGIIPLRRVFYRPDRIASPQTGLDLRSLSPADGWCDDPADEHYNQLIKLPFSSSHEVLWRDDHVYDIIVELGYNDDPPFPGQGSAIFMHIARDGYEPTQGCVALNIDDLRAVLKDCGPGTRMRINL